MGSDGLAPVFLELGPEVPLSAAELDSARSGEFSKLPAGWQLLSGYRVEMTLRFAEAASLPFPAGMIVGGIGAPDFDIVATETVPLVYLLLRRGQETLEMEVAQIETDLARLWSSSVTNGRPLMSTMRGRVGHDGRTAVLDAGDRLVRGTYTLARPAGARSKEEDYRYWDALETGARGVAAQLA
jgi:hypothetical protein